MATLDCTCSDLIYDEPVQNRLGQFGIEFVVGKVLWIDTSDNVYVTTTITEDQINSTNGVTGAASGSGDFGKAIFRRGKTYTITAGEKTLIDAAGYSDCTS